MAALNVHRNTRGAQKHHMCRMVFICLTFLQRPVVKTYWQWHHAAIATSGLFFKGFIKCRIHKHYLLRDDCSVKFQRFLGNNLILRPLFWLLRLQSVDFASVRLALATRITALSAYHHCGSLIPTWPIRQYCLHCSWATMTTK